MSLCISISTKILEEKMMIRAKQLNEKSKDFGSFVTIRNYFSFLGHSSTSSPENKEGKGVELEQEVGSQLKRF